MQLTCAQLRTFELESRSDLTCISNNDAYNVTAVGSQNRVELIDFRVASPNVMQLQHDPEEWGVRSLQSSNNILSIGGGRGRMFFFDFRVNALRMFHMDNPFLHVHSDAFPHAIYTHSWDPLGGRLFYAGGRTLFAVYVCACARANE